MPSRAQLANAIRVLSMDAVKQANSGHTGMPMGMADIAEVVWNDFLHHNPKNPQWLNRDRFILSNGHGSMLHYSLLHLTGYDVSLEDIKHFRQLHSKTPGHPEFGYTPGIETTTGPLGQGLANAVGMAIAERALATQFNRDGFELIHHHTYVFMGDGCLMEGISHEACSLAGVLGLGKLIAFWDDNGISIDGHVADWMNDDVPKRFESYHWHVIRDVNGHDANAIKQAILEAQAVTDRPSIICCKTEIAHGASKSAGTHHAHGAITDNEEILATKRALHWSETPFEIPQDIYHAWSALEKGEQLEQEWQTLFDAYQKQHPQLANQFLRRMNHELPDNWQDFSATYLTTIVQQNKEMATRKASQVCLNLLGQELPELLGGSADLTESNCTYHQHSNENNYIFYGVREFGMSAIMNGIALHGGFVPYGGTFLVFSDYARNAIRMAAIMKQRVVFIYTHDSIGVGEDGPTHQPIEHINALRAIPNLHVWRPCDLVETAVAWKSAMEQKHTPSTLLLTRQNLPAISRDEKTIQHIERGGYVLKDFGDQPEIILMATGSEVSLALESGEILAQQLQKNIRVVSMPCTELFLQQEKSYQESVLPKAVRTRIAIEAGSTTYWYQFVGLDGLVIGLDRFGESAPAKVLFEFFGFTISKIIDKIIHFIRGETA